MSWQTILQPNFYLVGKKIKLFFLTKFLMGYICLTILLTKILLPLFSYTICFSQIWFLLPFLMTIFWHNHLLQLKQHCNLVCQVVLLSKPMSPRQGFWIFPETIHAEKLKSPLQSQKLHSGIVWLNKSPRLVFARNHHNHLLPFRHLVVWWNPTHKSHLYLLKKIYPIYFRPIFFNLFKFNIFLSDFLQRNFFYFF